MSIPLSEEALSRGENILNCPPSASSEASSGKQGPTSQQAAMWRHKKRGTTYTIIGEAIAQASEGKIVDGEPVTIYRGEEGWIWVRSTTEFNDGRFERVSDEQPMAEDPKGLSAKHASAMTEGQTPNPNPLPADHAELVKSLKRWAMVHSPNSLEDTPAWQAATLITSQAEEIERLRAISADYHKSYLIMWPALNSRTMPLGGDNSVLTERLVDRLGREEDRAQALQSDIERIENELVRKIEDVARLTKENEMLRKHAFLHMEENAGRAFYIDVCRAEDRIKDIATLGRALLNSLPAHWHDDKVTDFSDVIEEIEKGSIIPNVPSRAQAAESSLASMTEALKEAAEELIAPVDVRAARDIIARALSQTTKEGTDA